ncbi:MAG: ester cyclase [Dehalococcoidia bacterium]|nr:ester cyclase [Dehalococcoidia bacterium]
MSDPASIAREYLKAAPSRDWDTCRRLFHPQYSYTGGDGQRQEGAEAGIAVADMYTSAFPDVKLEIKQIHVTGDVAIVEFVASGTHQGDLMGIAPTGRKMSIPVCLVLEIRDGKIYAEREYMDMAHMMQQLGVMPAPATA